MSKAIIFLITLSVVLSKKVNMSSNLTLGVTQPACSSLTAAESTLKLSKEARLLDNSISIFSQLMIKTSNFVNDFFASAAGEVNPSFHSVGSLDERAKGAQKAATQLDEQLPEEAQKMAWFRNSQNWVTVDDQEPAHF